MPPRDVGPLGILLVGFASGVGLRGLLGVGPPHLATTSWFPSRRRERHAKTIDIAQEEVLTCLGIHLYERLHRIWQKLRAEEQTWQMLFYLGVDALRKSFEVKNSPVCLLV